MKTCNITQEELSNGLMNSIEDDVKRSATMNESPKRSPKKSKRRNGPRDERRRSMKQVRRDENLKHLLSMSEQDVANEEELDLLNIHEPTFSAFAALFFEQEKMKIWNDFINRPEEDQEEILKGIRDLNVDYAEEDEEEEDFEDLKDESAGILNEVKDQRTVHPAFPADDRYKRINRKLRSVLRKKDLPKELLRKIEGEIIEFFVNFPNSIYISHASNSFSRMLVHALSQYLDLVSKSYDTDSGDRHTVVENKKTHFTPPSTSLADYLEAHHH